MIAAGEIVEQVTRLDELAAVLDPRSWQRWLAPEERSLALALRDPGRRRGWLAGRWLAKSLAARFVPGEMTRLFIQSRDGNGRPARQGEVRHSLGSPLRADRALGTDARVALDDGLTAVLHWLGMEAAEADGA